jgi:hypothetical protein
MADFTLKDERRPQPPPVPTLRQTSLGTMPFAPGTVLLEGEKRDLKAFGWQEGDPVPPDFAKSLAAAKEAAVADANSGTFRGPQPPPLQVPKEVPLEQLPPERRESLERLIKGYKEAAPQMAALAKDRERMAGLDPSVQRAIRAAQGRGEGIEVTSGRPDEPAPKMPAAAPGPAPLPAPPDDAKATQTHCPHCQWELSVPDPTTPSGDDEATFTVTLLGGQRFVKEYSFLGGRLRASFRSLTSAQDGRVAAQLSNDQRDGRVNNLDDLFRLGLAYRLALSLDVLTVVGQPMTIGRAVDDFLERPPKEVLEAGGSLLPELVEKLQAKEPLSAAPVWNMLADACRRFMALERALQDRAYRPGFSNAIGG